ncbi:MAG: acyl-CoA dehydrogenase [Myxococcaceae bacterium]|nr:acyl-CoA dehydrogenase [Myxococcaceae bacterium]
MSTGINRYKADLRELQFVLLEQYAFKDIAGKGPYEGWDEDTAKSILQETYRIAREVLGPLNGSGDREGCKLVDGSVLTPKGFKEAWKQLYETGLKQIAVPKEHGGQGAPYALYALVEEITSGANTAFNMYPGLAWGAAEVISECGTEAQGKLYADRMFNGTWGGTMCLTEPHAGSDVGSASSKAVKQADGRYKIQGTKIFISGGDHDLTENIVHLVLARIEGAPAGTKGLSLFIVPKFRVSPDGALGALNDVQVASIEHKLGINGSATCVLNFGENGECFGELVGTVENQGMPQMFRMMNGARIAVGIQGLAVASSAYLNALEYAKDRKQGANFKFWKDPAKPRVPIIEHPDVRRMLLELKAHTEGIRALVVKLAAHRDMAIIYQGKDDEKATYHQSQVDLLTPIVKAYASDEAYRLCGIAVQVYGGAGFLKDWPVEQYLRDSKIFSIYEGTNHIQAMDLVGRKLGQNGGANFQTFMSDIAAFVEKNKGHPIFGKEVEALGSASEAVVSTAMGFMGWSQSDKVTLVPLSANRFLEMMSKTVVGFVLLDAGVKAEQALAKVGQSHPDRAFYEGKRYSALYYGRNVLPQVKQLAELVMLEDSSPMEISDAAFASF